MPNQPTYVDCGFENMDGLDSVPAAGVNASPTEPATDAVAVGRRQGANVVECLAHVIRARVYRQTAAGDGDLAEVRAAIDAGTALAAGVGAGTYAAFLAEERARLDDDPAALKACADGYDAIGATGHAGRLRAELC